MPWLAVALALLLGCGARTGLDLDGGPAVGDAPVAPARATVRSVWPGNMSTCAVTPDGSVWCWGANLGGELGTRSLSWTPDPVRIEGVRDAVEVVGTCARTRAGSVHCWGDNRHGQLGDGTTEPREGAVAVRGIDDAVLLPKMASRCAVRASGTVACWGSPPPYLLGLVDAGDRGAPPPAPFLVPHELPRWSDVAEVTDRCVRYRSGEVDCVGVVIEGPDGRREGSGIEIWLSPLRVSGLADAVELEMGADEHCALRETGEIVCWPMRFPAGTGVPPPLVPGSAIGLHTVAHFDGTPSHGCGILEDGHATCWGSGTWGRLGNGEWSGSDTPVWVSGIERATTMAAGADHACAATGDGELRCWGRNHMGELGNREVFLETRGVRASNVPVVVLGLP